MICEMYFTAEQTFQIQSTIMPSWCQNLSPNRLTNASEMDTFIHKWKAFA